jgi:hypothetical protein
VAPSELRIPEGRARAYAALSILFGLTAGFGAAEGWARVADPRPPFQVVRENDLHLVGDVPVWESSTDRLPRACAEAHPERLRVMFLGTSVTYGWSLPASDAFTFALQERLNADRPDPGFCVMNFAQPGYTSAQKAAVGGVEIPRYHPAVVLWESWHEAGTWRLVDGAAYDLCGAALRDDGLPAIAGVPTALNHLLLLRSRFWRYLTLKFAERSTEDDRLEVRRRFESVVQTSRASHAALGVYLSPPLYQPFEASVGIWDHVVVARAAGEDGVPVYSLARALAGQDYLALRRDPCCHFNAAGHRAIVPIIERIVLDLLDGRPAPPLPPQDLGEGP